MRVPTAWNNAIMQAGFGPSAVLRQFLTIALEVAPSVLPKSEMLSLREATIIYALASSPEHSSSVRSLSRTAGMELTVIFFCIDGMARKGLVTDGGQTVALAAKSRRLVEAVRRRCSPSGGGSQ